MSSYTPATTRYIRNPAVAATEIDAETFLVEPEEGEVFYLDEISSALWRFLTEARSEDDIVETFAAAFPDTDRAKISADIDAALTDMDTRALIVKREAGGS